ncbi:uncharacterized protein LOC113006963 [Astatotilapia calliptera]|uniref:uncharacterized protein LOC113006963 n=1 Tax=Astatotilapia calliptera TaxID=8154 RepID=UPI000E42740C|nr:uncharacterized protein LOC113006963 [Astatotilapia calliptera]
MDPADSFSSEFNGEMMRMVSLLDRIAQSQDIRTMAVGLSAVDATIRHNPQLSQFAKDTKLDGTITAWREQVKAGELALSLTTSSPPLPQDNTHSPPVSTLPRTSSPSPQQPGSRSPAFFLAAMWSEDEEEVSFSPPVLLPSSQRKLRSGRRHSRTVEQTPLGGDGDCLLHAPFEHSDSGHSDIAPTFSSHLFCNLVLLEGPRGPSGLHLLVPLGVLENRSSRLESPLEGLSGPFSLLSPLEGPRDGSQAVACSASLSGSQAVACSASLSGSQAVACSASLSGSQAVACSASLAPSSFVCA